MSVQEQHEKEGLKGWGICAACKEFKPLTIHHIKDLNERKINRKIMICLDCHRTFETVYAIIIRVMELTKPKEDAQINKAN